MPADQDVTPAGWARVSFIRDLPGRPAVRQRLARDPVPARSEQPADRVREHRQLSSRSPSTTASRAASSGSPFTPSSRATGCSTPCTAKRRRAIPPRRTSSRRGSRAADVNFHNIITEWHATNPAANTFEGTKRELLRVGQIVTTLTHPFGDVEFNPTAKPGSPDYGLLYTSGSDLGFSNGGGPNANNPKQTQRLDTLISAVLRIDPRSPSVSGGTKGLGDYTIPAINKFAADGDPKTFGEIYAYGFRNTHRLSWDLMDGTMFGSDIGMNNIEEINIIHEGRNYGWMKREGIWENGIFRPGGALDQLFALPADVLDGRVKDEFTYPVAMYDHNEGQAVAGGFAYYGKIAALRGKFVFGDVVRGRVFVADLAAMKKADDGIPQTVAPIEEVQLYTRDATGKRTYVTFHELVEATNGATATRADLHLGRDRDGEIFLTSRQDGMIRMLVPDSVGSQQSAVGSQRSVVR